MTDSEIITAIIKGDTAQFGVLVEKYRQMVYRTCMGFVHNKDDADDLSQDVFIQAYQSLSKFKMESAFSTWLYRIAVNTSLNKLRKTSGTSFLVRLGSMFSGGSQKEPGFTVADPDDPEKILVRKEHSQLLQTALDSLPENQRTAIILSKYNELSQKEIAEIMNSSEGAVEALLQRAKKNLREKLSGILEKKIKK